MAGQRCPVPTNRRWSLDVTEDALPSGRKVHTVNLEDDRTRGCPAIIAGFPLPGTRKVAMLVAADCFHPASSRVWTAANVGKPAKLLLWRRLCVVAGARNHLCRTRVVWLRRSSVG